MKLPNEKFFEGLSDAIEETLKAEGLDSNISNKLAKDEEFQTLIKQYVETYLTVGEEEAVKLLDKYFHNKEFVNKFDDFLKKEDDE